MFDWLAAEGLALNDMLLRLFLTGDRGMESVDRVEFNELDTELDKELERELLRLKRFAGVEEVDRGIGGDWN